MPVNFEKKSVSNLGELLAASVSLRQQDSNLILHASVPDSDTNRKRNTKGCPPLNNPPYNSEHFEWMPTDQSSRKK